MTASSTSTRPIVRAALAAATFAVALSACSSDGDTATVSTVSTVAPPTPTPSAAPDVEPRVLTIAHIDAGPSLEPATEWFARALATRSGGALNAEFQFECCGRDVDVEQALLDMVRAGGADLGWVGVRAFAQAGTKAFEPLVAPLLVRSYAAQQTVIESDVANGLLAQLGPLGLIGLGLMPGGLRYPMSTGASLTDPADWAGLPIYTFQSGIGAEALAALGAEPLTVGFDARDQGLADGSIVGLDNTLRFQHDRLDVFSQLVSDLPLWPRISALVAAPGLDLSPQERQWIVEAVADVAARTPELSAIDREAEAEACALGDPGYVQAGPAAIAAFESALAPVEAVLAEQPAQAATLEALHELVADIPAEPAATCVHDTELPNTSAVTLRTLIDAPAETTALVPADGEANAAPGGTVPVTYVSDGLTISGRLTVPAGSGPFPAIVIVQPFGGLERAPGRLIDAGYAVLETDLRGRGTSDADPAAGGDLEMGATLDVVNAARALGSDPRIDSTKVALLGSGLGGLLAINAQVVAPDATAAVVAINPSSLDLWENIEFFLAPDDEFRAQIVETRGTPHDNPDLWADLSPVTFVDRVESPLLIVQGTGDTGNDPAWAHDAVEQYDAAGKDGRLTTLKGADFVLDPVWEQAIAEIETFLADSL